MPAQFLGRGMGGLMSSGAAAALDWYLAGGIPAANVVEHVENPTQGQAYGGGAIAAAWTVSFRTNLASTPSSVYAFDCQSGRLIIGAGDSNGIYAGSWRELGLFTTGDHTYMIVSNGTTIQAYRDNVATGSAVTASTDIGGTVKWRSSYASGANWPVALRAGHVANVGLDATMRAGLHASMMALA